jgi:DNA-binding NarL/FixJ family response regulator
MASVTTAIRVVLADDHPIWRDGVRGDLGDGFWVVGEAGTAAETIDLVRRHNPDLVVCDLNMPGGGTTVARECGSDTIVVMLTVSEDERDLLDAVAAGAAGYLVKSTPPEQLRAALWRAANGEPVFSPQLAALVLGEFRRLSRAASPKTTPLSAREREVLERVARGHTYREIGEELHIAEKTVENHVRNILGKLHLNRKAELIRYAAEHGIG